ncbi:hypothetical protein QBC46DRAFT_336126 [Diplogelasinospora grovesii]|uniref:Uncharacterized protein n=1 Tax=Diplogelasinospora grovesii TaxID=303347 RepID=A0AAN6NHM1_9PEZI|nr:hypothetical protein QBC46DRAFT_336126 [Diplogelasinospora grovesii]
MARPHSPLDPTTASETTMCSPRSPTGSFLSDGESDAKLPASDDGVGFDADELLEEEEEEDPDRDLDSDPHPDAPASAAAFRCIHAFDVVLAGSARTQPVELFFHPEWNATDEPAAVHFGRQSTASVALGPTRKQLEEEGGGDDVATLTIESEPVRFVPLQTLAAREEASRANAGFVPPECGSSWWQRRLRTCSTAPLLWAMVSLVFAIGLNVYWTPPTPAPSKLEFQDTYIKAAQQYTDAVLGLALVGTSSDMSVDLSSDMSAGLSYLASEMRTLCQQSLHLEKRRPELKQQCHDYHQACALATDANRVFGFGKRLAVAGLLEDEAISLRQLSDFLDDKDLKSQEDLEEDERDARIAMWRRHYTAELLLDHLPDWRKLWEETTAQLGALEQPLRQMDHLAGYITDGFEFEIRGSRGSSLPPQAAQDIKYSLNLLRSKYLPYATALLNQTVMAGPMLNATKEEMQALHTTLVSCFVIPGQSKYSPSLFPALLAALLRWFQWWWPSPAYRAQALLCPLALEDPFYSSIPLEDAVIMLCSRVREVDVY